MSVWSAQKREISLRPGTAADLTSERVQKEFVTLATACLTPSDRFERWGGAEGTSSLDQR